MGRTWPYFIDIETVPSVADWNELDERTADVYYRRFRKQIDELTDGGASLEPFVDHWLDNAALYAEFGKIVAISLGLVTSSGVLRVASLAFEGPQAERLMLLELKKMLTKAGILCAHNGKEFDFPYLQRKYFIHDIDLPDCLNTMGKKPWDILNEDTLEMWKFSQYKHYASLESIANVLGIESPKTDMDGARVAEVYYAPNTDGLTPWEHMEPILKRIANYCAGDIVCLANVWARMRREPMFTKDKIVFIEPLLKEKADGKESTNP